MTETRIRVEPPKGMKLATWLGAGAAVAAIVIGLFTYTDSRFDKLEDAIARGFHDAEISRATSADDLNYRLGFHRGAQERSGGAE